MGELERRRWVAPDGIAYRLTVVEQLQNSGLHLRRIRRLHFELEDGQLVATAVVPGHFMLDLATSFELTDLWQRAIGS